MHAGFLCNNHAFFSLCTYLNLFVFFFLADDEGGNVKPILLNGKSKSSQDELQVRLGFFLENNPRRNLRAPIQSCSSLTSTNTSPVSTLTGSSEADVSRTLQLHQEPNHYNTGCDSIGSMMSVSISEQSNASSSPMSRRHSVTSKLHKFRGSNSNNQIHFVLQLPKVAEEISMTSLCSKPEKRPLGDQLDPVR